MPANSAPLLARVPQGTRFSGSLPSPNADLDLRQMVLILRRRKAVVLIAIALGLALALMQIAVARRQYSATATIEINKAGGNSLGMLDLSTIAGSEERMDMDLLTEQAIIQDDTTALNVIEALKLENVPPYAAPQSQPVGRMPFTWHRSPSFDFASDRYARALGIFRAGLHVKPVKGTRLLTVTFTDTDPDRAASIANAIVDVYPNEYTQARSRASEKVSSALSSQLADLKSKVEQTEAKAAQFQRDSGLTGMAVHAFGDEGGKGQATSDDIPLERFVELNRDLTRAEVERVGKEAIYQMTETQDPDIVLGIGSSPIASELGQNSSFAPGSGDLVLLQQLRQQQAQLQVKLATSATKYGAKNPFMVQLQNEEAAFDAQIHLELDRIRKRARNDLAVATLSEDGLRKRVAAQEQLVDQLSEKADKLTLLQEEAFSNRAIYQDLYTKLEEASITAGMKASNMTVVDPARVPVEPTYPNQKITIAVGLLAGLFLGLIAAFSWDYFDDSLAFPEQVEELISAPLLGIIPVFARRRSMAARYGFAPQEQDSPASLSDPWVLRAPQSQAAEAYRSLRTTLLMSRAGEPPQVVLVMSGSPGEGKSTTCLNTAAAFAIRGDRVLFLDADLRKPHAHCLFGCANDVGLSSCLTSETDFREALQRHPNIESLKLLPAGPNAPNPAELLASRRFASLLEELRRHFDFIFIDSPPVLSISDALSIAPLADGNVLVLRSKRTSKRMLRGCLARMCASNSLPLGIVLNALDVRTAAYAGYGYGDTGRGYFAGEKS
jgi:succinoglycan biosynthesis transport protein ExoP